MGQPMQKYILHLEKPADLFFFVIHPVVLIYCQPHAIKKKRIIIQTSSTSGA